MIYQYIFIVLWFLLHVIKKHVWKIDKIGKGKKASILVKTKLYVDALNSPLFLWSVINVYVHVQLSVFNNERLVIYFSNLMLDNSELEMFCVLILTYKCKTTFHYSWSEWLFFF